MDTLTVMIVTARIILLVIHHQHQHAGKRETNVILVSIAVPVYVTLLKEYANRFHITEMVIK